MNRDILEGKWKQLKGSAKQQFAKLTDDDWQYVNGAKDKFVGRLQERYGIGRDEAQRQADEWWRAQHLVDEEDASKATHAGTKL
jgi:uncharacterized protein YjbJ (UPF0337 family)